MSWMTGFVVGLVIALATLAVAVFITVTTIDFMAEEADGGKEEG